MCLKQIIMRKIFFLGFLYISITTSFAQKESFDVATYTAPTGWTKNNTNKGVVSYSITNNQKGTYCQIGVYASTTSKGSLQADFESEWQDLVVKTYKPTQKPELVPAASENGWDAQGGAAPFVFSGAQSIAMLVTMSGNGRCMSIVILTNTEDYQADIEKFLDSVELKKIETTSQPVADASKTTKTPSVSPITNDGFHFSTINFDDGWTSTVHEDWVQVAKGNIKVLLHYATDRIDVSSMDYETISNNAWNTLVAPRYSSLLNFFNFRGSADFERPHFICGDVTDNTSGKKVYVVLFKRGNSGWIEIVAPDKNNFIQTFGIDINKVDYYVESKIWEPLQLLANYNKFAVAASDLKGKWTTSFSGMTQYVNVYTGANAGASSHSSSQVIVFTGDTYTWELKVASGMVGNLKFDGVKSNGKFTMLSNWQVKFSDIEGKPKIYDVYFSCVKGGRMLWLSDTSYPGYTGFGKAE